MSVKNLEDLFLHTLKDIYYAENQIVKALPKMVSKATAAPLKKGFEAHLQETKGQIERLEQIFELLGEKPKAEKCPAIEGLLKEADELIGEIKDAETRDAGMIAVAQAVEHYEIARYGTLVSWAELLGMPEAQKLLAETLEQEKATDVKLTKLAEGQLNKKAAA